MGVSPLSRGGRLRADTSFGYCLSLYSVRYGLYRERSPSSIPVHSLLGETYEGDALYSEGGVGAVSVRGWGWEESASYRRDVVRKCTTDHRGIKDQGKGMPCDSFSQGTKSLRRPL